MKKIAKGKFEVKSNLLPNDEASETIGAMRMRFDKKFQGPLEASGVVSMTGIMNRDIGSGGYVAIEKIIGQLDGRKGSFFMQHSSTMNRGKPTQSITVIPDSGTEDLTGLTGSLTVDIEKDGQHLYTFEYEL